MPMFPVNITKISKIRHRNGRYIDVHISIRIEALIKSTGYRHPFQQQWTKNEKSVLIHICVGIMSLIFSQFYQILKKKLLIIAFDTNSADSKKVF